MFILRAWYFMQSWYRSLMMGAVDKFLLHHETGGSDARVFSRQIET
jgi:hypothetical protein